jgi:hypothetical protein
MSVLPPFFVAGASTDFLIQAVFLLAPSAVPSDYLDVVSGIKLCKVICFLASSRFSSVSER